MGRKIEEIEPDGCRKHLLSNTSLAGSVGYVREWKQKSPHKCAPVKTQIIGHHAVQKSLNSHGSQRARIESDEQLMLHLMPVAEAG